MLEYMKSGQLLVGAVALSMLAACAQTGPKPTAAAAPLPPQAAVAPAPQPGAGWYQVRFDSNRSDLSANAQMIVISVATAVKNDSSVRVMVIGKTDRVGSESANMQLSAKRAQNVRDALIATKLVSPNRIDTRWMGEEKQEVATVDYVAEQRNRVVDITVQ